MKQEQFLHVIDRDEAEARFHRALSLKPLESENVPLDQALGRITADDVIAEVDVPSFDRSNYDGYAVRASDVAGAQEEKPRTLALREEVAAAGLHTSTQIDPGEAVAIATGGMIPRGADAVVMVEHADVVRRQVHVRKAVAPGFGVAFAGSDVARGETALLAATYLTSRETGVLAAIGRPSVAVIRRPVAAIISTGDELIPPGELMRPSLVYDSNTRILADAVRELGGEPRVFGIIQDDMDKLRSTLQAAIEQSDVVLLSGGTSKGEGDLCYRAVAELSDPGIVAHGVALKPGKPICLAAAAGKPVVILPGFPTSAVFTFHEFVAPVLRRLAGSRDQHRAQRDATLAVKVNSEIGRTEYLLVGLVDGIDGLAAFPMGKGSGSVTSFSKADGFVAIDRHTEIVEAGEVVSVQLIGRQTQPADLVVLGSHCTGLDWLTSQLGRRGVRTKFMAVGSMAGLQAVERGQCDLAGIHLLDPDTGEYNRPFLSGDIDLIPGYGRRQGIVFRRDDPRFQQQSLEQIQHTVREDSSCLMVNRNAGSGTRLLIDQLLNGSRPPGYQVQARSHNAVAAAVAQGRADWGLAIAAAAEANDLMFIPYTEEQFDFAVPRARRDRAAVVAFASLLREPATQSSLRAMGFLLP